MPTPICRKLFRQTAWSDLRLLLVKADNSIAARIPMIAIETSSSIKVKAAGLPRTPRRESSNRGKFRLHSHTLLLRPQLDCLSAIAPINRLPLCFASHLQLISAPLTRRPCPGRIIFSILKPFSVLTLVPALPRALKRRRLSQTLPTHVNSLFMLSVRRTRCKICCVKVE